MTTEGMEAAKTLTAYELGQVSSLLTYDHNPFEHRTKNAAQWELGWEDSTSGVFEDQSLFMKACGQTTTEINESQTELYLKLMLEEMGETLGAANPQYKAQIDQLVAGLVGYATIAPDANRVEVFDGLLDVVVVTAGAGLSYGLPMFHGWEEVIRSNLKKIDQKTGTVIKRPDGKVLKPEGWTPPNLQQVLTSFSSET